MPDLASPCRRRGSLRDVTLMQVLSSSMGAAAAPGSAAAGPKIGGPAPLRLDEQGREIDELGRPIERRPAAPAAKVIKLARICLHPSLPSICERSCVCNVRKRTDQHKSLQ